MWQSGQRTRPPCAVQLDVLSGEVHASARVHPPTRVISNNSYAHDEQGVNSRQVRGFNGVLNKL